jgi:hypothetical protein
MVTMDVRASLQTLDVLESSCDAFYVPCHAEPSDDIVPLVKKNRDNLFAIGDEVLDICSEPSSREDILSKIITRYNLALSPTQYVLDLATISAHIAFLSDEKKIEYVVSEGRLLWKQREKKGPGFIPGTSVITSVGPFEIRKPCVKHPFLHV